MKDIDDDLVEIAAGCLLILLVIVILLGISAFCGWLTMLVLAAFGVKLSFWICWALWFLVSSLIRKVTR